jgi:glucokinase
MDVLMKKNYIGIDIGGTKTATTVWEINSQQETPSLKSKRAFETRKFISPYDAIREIVSSLSRQISETGIDKQDVYSIGISCGGPLDRKSGKILSPPNLPGWDNIDIVDVLQKSFGIPVFLENDANACALAEKNFGIGKDIDHLLFLTFGTGLGAGLILNGSLYRGISEMAGEIGHIRLNDEGPIGYGKRGSAEGFCSGAGITQIAKELVHKNSIYSSFPDQGNHEFDCMSAKSIALAAKEGNALAKEVYGISGSYLGKVLAILIDILNPEMIIIGSIFTRDYNLLWPKAHEILKSECLPQSFSSCRIETASLGELIGDYAALSVALNLN